MGILQTKLSDKLKEALKAVMPIIGIVLFLSFSIAPIPPSILLLFLFGAVLLVVGMMFFTLGAELSMTPMGEKLGTKMAMLRMIFSWALAVLLFLFYSIVVRTSQKNPIMKAIMEQVGTGSPAGAVVFSLPVTSTAGLRMVEEMEG